VGIMPRPPQAKAGKESNHAWQCDVAASLKTERHKGEHSECKSDTADDIASAKHVQIPDKSAHISRWAKQQELLPCGA